MISRTSGGRSSGDTTPAFDRVLEIVAHVRDPVGPSDDLAFGRGRSGPIPRVVANGIERLGTQIERSEDDVGAVDRMVIAPVDERRQRALAGMPTRTMAAVVADGGGLDERHVEPKWTCDRNRDLADLDGVGQSGADVVVVGCDEDLTLACEPTERPAVVDSVEVALEAESEWIGFLGVGACAGAG